MLTEPLRGSGSVGAVLIVGGSPSTRRVLAGMVAPLGVKVDQVASPRTGLRRLREREYAALLLAMDEADAIPVELAKRLHGSAESTPPIVVITKTGTLPPVETAGGRVAVELVKAPVDPSLLRAKVRALVERARLRNELLQDVEEKSKFLSMVAHELRAPLSVATGYLSMIREGSFGELPHGLGSAIGVVTSKVAEIQQLVEDLLIASRLDGGEVQLRIETIDLGEAVDSALARIGPRALLCDASIDYRPTESAMVAADRRYLGRILDNLLNNALTYSEGQPQIKVMVTDSGRPAVRVEDHGIGIPSAIQENIFRRGARGNDSDPRRPGTGLGLYVSRGLAEKLSGSLELLSSSAARGSVFELILPGAA